MIDGGQADSGKVPRGTEGRYFDTAAARERARQALTGREDSVTRVLALILLGACDEIERLKSVAEVTQT